MSKALKFLLGVVLMLACIAGLGLGVLLTMTIIGIIAAVPLGLASIVVGYIGLAMFVSAMTDVPTTRLMKDWYTSFQTGRKQSEIDAANKAWELSVQEARNKLAAEDEARRRIVIDDFDMAEKEEREHWR